MRKKIESRHPFCLTVIFPPIIFLLRIVCKKSYYIFSSAFSTTPKVRYQSMQIYVHVFYLVASRILVQVLKRSPSSAFTNTIQEMSHTPQTLGWIPVGKKPIWSWKWWLDNPNYYQSETEGWKEDVPIGSQKQILTNTVSREIWKLGFFLESKHIIWNSFI